MRITRQRIAWGVLLLTLSLSLSAGLLRRAQYATQFRDTPNAGISRQFPLGTDELGRDRFTRLLYGTRISLLLAPAAALVSTLLAALIGGLSGYLGGWCDRLVARLIDLMLSLPWLFLLISVRAMLPLNVSPTVSVLITFALLALLGWPSPARVIRAGAGALRNSEMIVQAKACGVSGWRLLRVHVAPNLKPVLLAKFWTSLPIFILSEANLGMLGLGVAEPLPSWGNLLRQLETAMSPRFGELAPLLVLVIVVGCLQLALPAEEVRV